VRLLTPTENRRLNEAVGFLTITAAVLIALALLSYSPHDASFNVSAQPPDSHPARNWIGPLGAYGADVIFQVFGYAAFLLPMGIFAIGVRWFRSQPLDSPLGKLIGYACLVLSLPALLTLWSVPDVRGAIPPGGVLGALLAEGLRAKLNLVGANLVALASFLAALIMTTRFSILETHSMLSGPVNKLDMMGRLKARWAAWHEGREKERLRKRLETIKLTGRQPVAINTSAPRTCREKRGGGAEHACRATWRRPAEAEEDAAGQKLPRAPQLPASLP
jgi:S-DNA-T family DNA segregation ATPase FtsK/SpoIIIE